MAAGKAFDAKGISVGQRGRQLVDPPVDVGLPRARLDLLVEHREQRERVSGTAVVSMIKFFELKRPGCPRRIQWVLQHRRPTEY
ncbi:hypothetical protein ACFXA3_11235 [Streptomyces sp. NPDC059456]|uniref:hypothetical protein n=1 Tax=Streptomyces sp. NPDC059456 TaxID=3346838 RepID=UPI0036CE30B0